MGVGLPIFDNNLIHEWGVGGIVRGRSELTRILTRIPDPMGPDPLTGQTDPIIYYTDPGTCLKTRWYSSDPSSVCPISGSNQPRYNGQRAASIPLVTIEQGMLRKKNSAVRSITPRNEAGVKLTHKIVRSHGTLIRVKSDQGVCIVCDMYCFHALSAGHPFSRIIFYDKTIP